MITIPNEPLNCNNGNGFYTDQLNKTPGGIGLTKREYFAALAMQAVESGNVTTEHNDVLKIKDVATRAVSLADALIEELNK